MPVENENTETQAVEAAEAVTTGGTESGQVENVEPKTVDDLPKWAQDEIKKHRKGEEKARKDLKTSQEANERNEKIRKTLVDAGLLAADDANADKLSAEELKAAQDDARKTKIEFAVFREAAKAEADPESLLDSRSFMKSVRDLDPNSDDFSSDLAEAISEATGKSDRYKKTGTKQPEKRSGGDHSGGANTGRQLTEADLQNMSPSQISTAREKGLLNRLQGIS